MEEWQLDFEWLKVRHAVKEKFAKNELPNLNAILFLIGINEVGIFGPFTKEQKQDLMHVAVCRLLEKDGMYEKIGTDDEGWPHFEQIKQLKKSTQKEQELLLKIRIIEYFKKV